VVERAGLELLIPCHPADALALAVRAGKPIMAQDSALTFARSAPGPGAPAGDAVRQWVDRLRPTDFGDDRAR
jgi:bifunctional DNase/RNase